MIALTLILIAVPLAEIALFITIGGQIGLVPTLVIVVATAVLGAFLLRRQGLGTIARAQAKMERGEIPFDALFDALCLFLAGAFLLTPGFLTDTFGFLLLTPLVRAALRGSVWRAVEKRMAATRAAGFSAGAADGRAWEEPPRSRASQGTVIDAEIIEQGEPAHPTDLAADRPDDLRETGRPGPPRDPRP